METTIVLKAIADETRFKILKMLLNHKYCVKALAQNLGLSEAAISQHLKVLREADLLTGEKEGYFMHYEVNRNTLHELASEIKKLADIKREISNPESVEYESAEQGRYHIQKPVYKSNGKVKPFYNGKNREKGRK